MKRQTKTELVQAKLDPNLAAAVDVLCERSFKTRSEVIRSALLRELQANGLCAIVRHAG